MPGFKYTHTEQEYSMCVFDTYRMCACRSARVGMRICERLTLVVLILFPEEHIHPELSGRVLHSSPSRHGSISHHHFPITIDAVEGEHRHTTEQVSLSCRHRRTHNHVWMHTQTQTWEQTLKDVDQKSRSSNQKFS